MHISLFQAPRCWEKRAESGEQKVGEKESPLRSLFLEFILLKLVDILSS